MSSRRFAELRFPEVAERVSADSVLVLPIGSVEQHGPHLPLVTDLLIAEATADAVLDAFGDELDLWLLPPLAYSKSNEHAWAPGSVWLNPSTLLALLDDVGRSLAEPGRIQAGVPQRPWRQLVVAQRRLPGAAPPPRAHDVPRAPGGPARSGRASRTVDELGMGIHAGLHETSVVLHLRPDLVDMTLGSPQRAGVVGRQPPCALRRRGVASAGWPTTSGPTATSATRPARPPSWARSCSRPPSPVSGEQLGEVREFRFR